MNPGSAIDRLEGFAATVAGAVGHLSDADARWRPESGGWTLLEIVNHLADEEVLDFRQRLRLTLEAPEADWPPIDPEGDIERLGYNERGLAESLERFARARAETVTWLRGLEAVDWSTKHEHPSFGSMRAGDLLASLSAHDALHLRQIAARLFDLSRRDFPDFDTRYAGSW